MTETKQATRTEAVKALKTLKTLGEALKESEKSKKKPEDTPKESSVADYETNPIIGLEYELFETVVR